MVSGRTQARSAEDASSPGFGMKFPVSQIISGCPGQSGVEVVSRGCRLSALVGLGRPRDGPEARRPGGPEWNYSDRPSNVGLLGQDDVDQP